MGFFSKIKEGLKKTGASISQSVTSVINSFTKIDEDLFEELEEILAPLAIPTIRGLRIALIGEEGTDKDETIKKITTFKNMLFR